MINLLVVDDEPINADGISIYLAEKGDTDWNIITAYSGMEALTDIRERVDILVSDVMMPMIDGFSLNEQLLQRWPRMRTVFLTGYPQVDKVQRAIRAQNVVDYVLKTEEEESVLTAVNKAVSSFWENMRTRDLLEQARQDIEKARPLLTRELMMNILRQRWNPKQPLQERFHQLALKLRADQPVLLLLAQMGEPTLPNCSDEMAGFALENLVEKYLWPTYRVYALCMDNRRVVAFLQRNTAAAGIEVSYVYALLEGVRQTFRQKVGGLSLVLDCEYCSWAQVAQRYQLLTRTLERSLLVDEEVLLVQSREDKLEETVPGFALTQLREQLERGDYQQAADCLMKMEQPQTCRERMELYRRLLKLCTFAIEARADSETYWKTVRVPVLQLDEAGWDQTLHAVAALFASMSRGTVDTAQKTMLLVEKIEQYVEEHLADDLSLTRMADVTGRSVSTLSRIFKQCRGVNYNDYVSSRRMEHASALLRENPSMRLNEVTAAVGYTTPSYLIRMFRETYGVTPREYQRSHARHAPERK